MDLELKQKFLTGWQTYFPQAELPLVFFFTDDSSRAFAARKSDGWRCVICDLAQVRKGTSILFDAAALGCGGAREYFGLAHEPRTNFEYFLSYGLPGKIEGIRHKKTPELVNEGMRHQQPFHAPGKYIAFKRWDNLDALDEPLGAIFFAGTDVLSGLFSLANFDEPTPYGVITPSCAGCSAIVYYPYKELQSDNPRAILGMFDISARPCVPSMALTFAVPWPKFIRMINNMEESFLITPSWAKIKQRISPEL